MKKLLLLLMVLLLSGCGFFRTELVDHEDSIHLEINEQFIEYMPYDNIPSYDLILPQNETIKTTKYRSDVNEIIFSGNDDFVISEMLESLFTEYQAKGRFSTRFLSKENKYETHLNKDVVTEDGKIKSERVYLKVKDATITNEIGVLTLENGLQLTVSYARFDVEGEEGIKTYYSWQYSESIRMILYYPLMVVRRSNGDKNILIVALPNGVINKVETRYNASGLVENDDFLEESYYTYEYADFNKADINTPYSNTLEVERMKNYYTENFDGHSEDGKFVFTYLGFDFEIEFGEKKFIIRFRES